jgi:hypothetical protein
VARDQPAADVAESKNPISVLNRPCGSNVEPLRTLLLSGRVGCVRSSHVAPPATPLIPEHSCPLVTNDVVCSTHRPPQTRTKAQCDRRNTHSGKVYVRATLAAVTVGAAPNLRPSPGRRPSLAGADGALIPSAPASAPFFRWHRFERLRNGDCLSRPCSRKRHRNPDASIRSCCKHNSQRKSSTMSKAVEYAGRIPRDILSPGNGGLPPSG